MSINSLNSANVNITPKEIETQNGVNIPFRANEENSLQRTPKNDEFVIKNSVGVKIGVGAVIATFATGVADAVFNDGKNLKKIFKNFGKKPKRPVKDIDLSATPSEKGMLNDAIDRLKGKTAETQTSAGTKAVNEAADGSKRTYSGSSSSSSASTSRSRGKSSGKKASKVTAKSEVEPKVKPSGREVVKGEVNNYRNAVEDAKLANNADQAHLSDKERKFVEQGLEDAVTEVKSYNEVLSDVDKQTLQNHQEKVGKEYVEAHRLENNSTIVEPKAAAVSKDAIDKLGDEIKGLDGSIKKLEQQIAGAKKFGKNTENLEKQLANLQEKRATKFAELEGMKKPVAEPRAEGKKGIEIDKKVETYKQHLNGKMNVQVGTKKSKELQELAKYYHAEELRAAKKNTGLRPDPLAKGMSVLSDAALERMEWVSRNLTEDEPLRRALDIPKNFKMEYSDVIRQPYVKTNKGRYIVFERERQLWHEFDKSTWEKIQNRKKSWYENARSIIRSSEDGFVIKGINPKNGKKAKYVIQSPEKQARVVFDKNGAIKYQGKEKEVLKETLHESELVELLCGTPERRAYTKHTPDGKVSGTIQQYVSTYPEGTFKKSSKRITLFENGEPRTVKLAYEGDEFDIDVYGRILKKQKVRDPIRERAIDVAERESSYYQNQRGYVNNSRSQRRKVNA